MKKFWSNMSKGISNIKSTRFWFAIIAFFVNVGVFCFGIFNGIDPTSLGTGLALVNTPLYGYIFGRTVRPGLPTPTENGATNEK